MNTLFLSTVLGWFMVLMSLLMVFHTEHLKRVMSDVIKHPGLFFVVAMVTTILGLLMVLSHPVWVRGWPVVITLLSWLILLSGLLRLFFYDFTSQMAKSFLSHPLRMKITGIILFIIGLGLLYPALYIR